MTNELEKQFFQCFGIEPEEEKYCLWECKEPSLEHVPCNKECKYQRHDIYYPQITDRILLELICIANEAYIDLEGTDIETMKNSLLENFIFFRRDVYSQVRTLFEEG